jgi:hypothetical protein
MKALFTLFSLLLFIPFSYATCVSSQSIYQVKLVTDFHEEVHFGTPFSQWWESNADIVGTSGGFQFGSDSKLFSIHFYMSHVQRPMEVPTYVAQLELKMKTTSGESSVSTTGFAINDPAQLAAKLNENLFELKAAMNLAVMPTSIQYEIAEGTNVDSEFENDVIISNVVFFNGHGDYKIEDGQKYFCLEEKWESLAPLNTPNPVISSNQFNNTEFSSVRLAKTTGWHEDICMKQLDYCVRPTIRVQYKVSSVMGEPMDFELPRTGDISGVDHVYVRCSIDLEASTEQKNSDEEVGFYPEELKPIKIEAKDHKGNGVNFYSIEAQELNPSDFGVIVDEAPVSVEDGSAYVSVHAMDPAPEEEKRSVLKIKACPDTPDNLLGISEAGTPNYWEDLDVKLIVHEAPQIRYYFSIGQELERKVVEKSSSTVFHQVKTITEEINEGITVELDVRLKDIDFNPVQDDTGFKGHVMQYSGVGEIVVHQDLSPISFLNEHLVGQEEDEECGWVNFNYTSTKNTSRLALKQNKVKVFAYYRHYVADADSPIQHHPYEGFGYVQKDVYGQYATIEQGVGNYDRVLDEHACQYEYQGFYFPGYPVPVMHSNFTLLSMVNYQDDCYGVDSITLPLKENAQEMLTRKVMADGKFDYLQRAYSFDLDRNDQAACWDIPEDYPGLSYDYSNTYARGHFIIEQRAYLVGGRLELSL